MNKIKNGIYIVMVLLWAQCAPGQNENNDQANFIVDLEDAIESKMVRYGVTGASIALIDDQRILWAQGFGHTDKGKTKEVDEETLFSVQSLSKTYLATAALMEVNKGNLDLDLPLINYYPEFSIHSRYGNTDHQKITIRHLLSHRAGLLQEAAIGNNYDTATYSFEEHIRSFETSWTRFPVGQFFSYSNMGMDLVGYILSERSDLSYESYMDRRLLSPLGMSSTTFDQSKAYDSENLAKGYFGEKEMLRTLIVPLAAGGMYSSAADMAKFISFQLRGCTVNGDTIISQNLINEMYSVQSAIKDQEAGYGLGTYIVPIQGTPMIHHIGGGYGYSAKHGWIPEHKIGFVILSNDGNGSPFVHEVSQLALNFLLEWKGVNNAVPEIKGLQKRSQVDYSPSYLESLTGTYKGNGNVIKVFVENRKLAVQKYGRTFLLDAASENEFYSHDGQRFIFETNEPEFPKHLVNLNSDNADFYIFNDREDEEPGLIDPQWESITGTYLGFANRQPMEFQIFIKNGYLYTSFLSYGGATKIHPHSTNLFFTSDGESVVIEGGRIYIGNRMFVKRK